MRFIRKIHQEYNGNFKRGLNTGLISFEELRITGTEESFVVLQPPVGKRFFAIGYNIPLYNLANKVSKTRTTKEMNAVSLFFKENEIKHSPPFLGAGNSTLMEFILPNEYLNKVYDCFCELAKSFGEDCLLDETCETHVMPDDLPKDQPGLVKLLNEMSSENHESHFWRYLETDNGKMTIATWVSSHSRFFLDDLNEKHAIFARITRYLGWPIFYPVDIDEKKPNGRFQLEGLEGVIDYLEELNLFEAALKMKCPAFFRPLS